MKKYLFILLMLSGCGGVFTGEEFYRITKDECIYRGGLHHIIVNVNHNDGITYYCYDGSIVKKYV